MSTPGGSLHTRAALPELRVVVLESEFAGFGASGRNGGWLSGFLAGSRERRAMVITAPLGAQVTALRQPSPGV